MCSDNRQHWYEHTCTEKFQRKWKTVIVGASHWQLLYILGWNCDVIWQLYTGRDLLKSPVHFKLNICTNLSIPQLFTYSTCKCKKKWPEFHPGSIITETRSLWLLHPIFLQNLIQANQKNHPCHLRTTYLKHWYFCV